MYNYLSSYVLFLLSFDIFITIFPLFVPNKFDKYLATSALQVGFPFFGTAFGGNLSNVQKLCLPPKCNPVRCTETSTEPKIEVLNCHYVGVTLKCTLSRDGFNWLMYTHSMHSDMIGEKHRRSAKLPWYHNMELSCWFFVFLSFCLKGLTALRSLFVS